MKTGSIKRKGVPSQHGGNPKRRNPDHTGRLEALAWELPSGERLAEYALRARFFTPSLLTGCDNALAGGGTRRSDTNAGGQR